MNGKYAIDKDDIAPRQSVIDRLCHLLSVELEKKYKALERRETFTAYKTAEQGTYSRPGSQATGILI